MLGPFKSFALDLLRDALNIPVLVTFDHIPVIPDKIVRVDRLVNSPLPIEQRLGSLMLAVLDLQIPIQKQRLMQPLLSLLSMRPFLATPHLIPSLLMRLSLGVLVGRIVPSGFIMIMMMGMSPFLLGFDDIVLIAEYLLFGLEQLEVGRGALGHLVVVFYFEFACHFNNDLSL